MTVTEIKDKSGKVIGTVSSYPDTAEDRAALILREGAKAAEELRLAPGQRRRFGRRSKQRHS